MHIFIHYRLDKSPLVGGIPGVTKRVASTKVVSNPDVYMIDTPGIFIPDVKNAEVGLKMALCGTSFVLLFVFIFKSSLHRIRKR